MPLRLHNTLTRQAEPVVAIDPTAAHITFYTCGPTVYDNAHIGNFRAFLAADVLRRWLESPLCELTSSDGKPLPGPRRVTHVMNITDVGHMTDDTSPDAAGEDRMAVAGRRLAEAKKSGKLPAGANVDPSNPVAIANFYADRFLEDARLLGLKVAIEAQKDATLMPRPTQKIPGMIAMVHALISRGHAYAVGPAGNQTVYFNVPSFPSYGRLSGNTLDKLREGAGGRISESNQSEKRHPADFMLWKADPAHIMKWDSPWGAGYPGWHLECSVMAAERLGTTALRAVFGRAAAGDQNALVGSESGRTPLIPDALPIIDLHSGGEDNIFPHHECELAQSCCAFNAHPEGGSFSRHWFHVRHLFVEGQKMSKSLGNFFTIGDLLDKGYDAAAIRLELIKTHYRSNANFTEQGLKDSARTIERWRKARWEIARRSMAWANTESRAVMHLLHSEFSRLMHDDLNIAGAIGLVNSEIGTLLAREYDPAKLPSWTDDETRQHCAGIGAGKAPPLDIFERIEPILGVLELNAGQAAQTSIGLFAPGVDPDPAVIAKLEERRAARAAKDFKKSDAIRDELLKMGYAIKDVSGAGGQVEVKRA
jgi:cysteinyl-tRNA synthetase